MQAVISFISFIEILLGVVPELNSLYEEHIDDYDGLLEHVFMGDVTRFAEELNKESPKSECLLRLLAFLDRAYLAEDEKLQELISVSFLENLTKGEDSYEGIKSLLSGSLSSELAKYG